MKCSVELQLVAGIRWSALTVSMTLTAELGYTSQCMVSKHQGALPRCETGRAATLIPLAVTCDRAIQTACNNVAVAAGAVGYSGKTYHCSFIGDLQLFHIGALNVQRSPSQHPEPEYNEFQIDL